MGTTALLSDRYGHEQGGEDKTPGDFAKRDPDIPNLRVYSLDRDLLDASQVDLAGPEHR
jgi:hypothetical protein